MYLASLELQGFKSFPDKTQFQFDRGLTAVVGPNGCGKSNIGDAIRWVLGEQSTKTLRGNRMEDVIFSGTKTRKPQGFAMVTLTLADTVETLGETYGDPVQVSRKLYRDGESEYRINGKQVRLRDITELFYDTGLGKDGYALIGQGRIAEIISVKSTDRRDIFEEAAGISGFRHKKEDAERQLERAENNLVRLQDILAELTARLGPLKTQAEKAKQYLDLAKEQETLEVSLWVKRLDALSQKRQELDDQLLQESALLQNCEHAIQTGEARVENAYAEMQKTTLEIESMRQDMAKAEETLADLGAQIAVLETELRHGEEMRAQLDGQMLAYAGQQDAQAEHAEDLEAREAELQQREDALQATLKQSEVALAQWQEKVSTRSAQAKAAAEEARETMLAQQADTLTLQTLQERHEAQEAEEDQDRAALEQATQALELANTHKTEAESAAHAADEDVQEAENRLAGFQKLAEHAGAVAEQRAQDRDQLYFSLREKEQRMQILQEAERNLEGYAGSVRQVLRADGGKPYGVCGTVASLCTVPAQYSVAIETALGGAMQNLVVVDEDAAKHWIRFLAEHKAGRATFLPLTTIHGRTLTEQGLSTQEGFTGIAADLVETEPKYQEIFRYLLGRVVIAEDLDSAARIAKAYGHKFKVVSLDGQVVNPGGSFTGGSAQKSSGVLSRKAELQTLEDARTTLETQVTAAKNAYQEAAQKAAQTQGQAEEAAEALQQARDARTQAYARLETCTYQVQEATTRRDEADERLEALLQMRADLLDEVQVAEQALEKSKVRYEVAQQKAREADISQAELQNKQAELAQRAEEVKLSQVRLEKDREVLQADKDRFQAQQAELEEKIRDLERQKQESLEETQKNQAALDTARQSRTQLEKEKADTAENIRLKSKIHDQQDADARQAQSGLSQLYTEKERILAQQNSLQEKRDSAQKDYDGVTEQLYTQYNLTVSKARAQAEPQDDLQAASARLKSIKAKIRSLGNVNVGAIEEYKEVSERHAFMTSQIEDVTHSKAELERLIQSLTGEMEQRFIESFNAIDQNFRRIFRDLFEGGEAKLSLSDPEHVLESGIEIQVAPPGKVIKNLIALSGGEQAFVAIALYLAILELHPAPFCVLDEIDAALDEGNVQKYVRYLRHYTNTTQFILITHRRAAMEEADLLYGVTMQEDGVSRLLRMTQPPETDATTQEA